MSSPENAASQEGCETSAPTLEDERRIVLVGKTGTGRSSSGNTLLGRSAFWVDASPRSATTQCKKQSELLDGRNISVIDTPGFFNTSLSLQEVMSEVGRCIDLSSPGPHAFLVTLQPARFTQEERDSLEWIKATFGSGVTRFIIVLFTCGDRLQGKRIEDFLKESDELLEFVSSCHGGYHVIDNSDIDRTTQSSQQVVQLLEKIDKLVVDNGCGYYTKEMFEEADRTIREVQERIIGKRVQPMSPLRAVGDKNEQVSDGERKRREEEARKRAERLFWCELVTAMGKGAAEGAGVMGKDKEKGKAVKKGKVVERAVALAASPLSISSAAKVVGGAVREGSKVLYKHRKTFLP